MSQSAVQEILERIHNLPDEDRLVLEQRLAEMLEAEWQKAAVEARQEAKRRGLDQVAIDKAISDLRHPR